MGGWISTVFCKVSDEEQGADDEFVIGRCFKTLPGTYLTEGKSFFYFDGSDHCNVVMSTKGFFLKVMYDGNYYYMSDLIGNSKTGKIWVKNKRGSAISYNVAYSEDDLNGESFGRFTESSFKNLIKYEDLKTGKIFTLNVLTGEVTR